MGYFTDSIRALTLTMKSVFRKPTTVHYPAEKRVRAERYRNSFALLHDEEGDELCVGCVQCEKICPSDVITVIAEKKDSPVTGKRRGYAKDFTLDLNACIYCELCVQVCPTDAIIMTRQPEIPSYAREDLVLTMERLYQNETDKPPAWGTATKLMGMQDPKRGAPPPPGKKAPEKKAPEVAPPPKTPEVKPAPDKPETGNPAQKPEVKPAPQKPEVKPVPDKPEIEKPDPEAPAKAPSDEPKG